MRRKKFKSELLLKVKLVCFFLELDCLFDTKFGILVVTMAIFYDSFLVFLLFKIIPSIHSPYPL